MPKKTLMTPNQMPDATVFGKEAHYKEQKNPEYQGNALIEALPLPVSSEELKLNLIRYPLFDEIVRLLRREELIRRKSRKTGTPYPISEPPPVTDMLPKDGDHIYVGPPSFDDEEEDHA